MTDVIDRLRGALEKTKELLSAARNDGHSLATKEVNANRAWWAAHEALIGCAALLESAKQEGE